jgi:PhnB protein
LPGGLDVAVSDEVVDGVDCAAALTVMVVRWLEPAVQSEQDACGTKHQAALCPNVDLPRKQPNAFFSGRLSVQLLLVRRPIGEMVFVTLAAIRENRGKLMVTDFVTYLSFDGRCEEAFKRYEKVFKGKIAMMMRHSDAPPGSGVPQNSETANRIMHARLEVGGRLLMGGDAPAHSSSRPQGFCVSVAVDDPAEAERIFSQLSESGAIVMPIAETFWAQRFGMVTDEFGTPWMVNCEKPIG